MGIKILTIISSHVSGGSVRVDPKSHCAVSSAGKIVQAEGVIETRTGKVVLLSSQGGRYGLVYEDDETKAKHPIVYFHGEGYVLDQHQEAIFAA